MRARCFKITQAGTLTIALATSAALATGAGPLGDDFQVNTYTTSTAGQPSIAVDADGDFVVIWRGRGSPGDDTDDLAVHGRLYSSDGSPQGSQFQINTHTTGRQTRATVDIEPDGDFVVVWSSPYTGTDTDGQSVHAQRYSSDGTPRGDQFQVNAYTTGIQTDAAIGIDDDGDFVIVWQGNGSSGTDINGYSIRGQRFASDGSRRGDEFQANTYTIGDQLRPDVGLDADGDFVVVWQSFWLNGPDVATNIRGQRYSSDGNLRGDEFQVNTYTTNGQTYPEVDLDTDGHFVVIWESNGSLGNDDDFWSIQGQRYSADGAPQGDQFQINSYTPSLQIHPSLAVAPSGDFTVSWDSSGSYGNDPTTSIQAQLYASDGSPRGNQFQVNSYTFAGQDRPSIGFGAGGDFVVAWQSSFSGGTDTSDSSIQARRFRDWLFTDGFESGDTSAWTKAVIE